jgi:hypothetical protein
MWRFTQSRVVTRKDIASVVKVKCDLKKKNKQKKQWKFIEFWIVKKTPSYAFLYTNCIMSQTISMNIYLEELHLLHHFPNFKKFLHAKCVMTWVNYITQKSFLSVLWYNHTFIWLLAWFSTVQSDSCYFFSKI